MSILPHARRLAASLLASRSGRYGLAAAAVALAFGLRSMLEPAFGGFHPYSTFLPMVMWTAYVLGRGPAGLALGLSAILGYVCFTGPEHGWVNVRALSSLGFFVTSGGIAVLLISALVRALDTVAAALARAEMLARSHAELFRDLNERMTIHLQLVAGLLQLHAIRESDQTLSQAFAIASEKSLQISRAHLELSGRSAEDVDFTAFAQELTRIAPDGAAVEVTGAALVTSASQATSLGVVLLECVAAHARQGGAGVLRVAVGGDRRVARLSVSVAEPGRALHVRALHEAFFLRAMMQQLGGEIVLAMEAGRPVLELRLPSGPPPPTTSERLEAMATVH